MGEISAMYPDGTEIKISRKGTRRIIRHPMEFCDGCNKHCRADEGRMFYDDRGAEILWICDRCDRHES